MTRVLVADDDHLISKLLKLELGQKGFDVVTAYDGNQAVKIISNAVTMPDIILLDINMPELNGFKVLEKIKSNPHTKDLPVIMISTRKQVEDLADSVKKGVIDYVIKPFTMDEIFTRLLTVHRKQRQGITALNLERVSQEVMNCNQQPVMEEQAETVKKKIPVKITLPPPPLYPQKKRHKSVLLIEDHEANKSSLMVPFIKLDYEVQVITKQQYRAVNKHIDEKIIRGAYDAVILDMEPDPDQAFEICRHFRGLLESKKQKLVIIGMGNDDKLETRDAWLGAGMNNYFQKPVPARAVVECVVNFIRKVIV